MRPSLRAGLRCDAPAALTRIKKLRGCEGKETTELTGKGSAALGRIKQLGRLRGPRDDGDYEDKGSTALTGRKKDVGLQASAGVAAGSAGRKIRGLGYRGGLRQRVGPEPQLTREEI
jgi:hypothetical protein